MNRIKLFWDKVDKVNSRDCWEWKASRNRDGYGQFWIGHMFIAAHRYSWELSRGCLVPEDKMILHLCDNPGCVNPDHLYCGTQSDNMRDRHERGLKIPPHITANPKLYEGEIWLIRKLRKVKSKRIYTRYKFPERLVAKVFKVDQSLIHLIWNSDKWLSKEGTYG